MKTRNHISDGLFSFLHILFIAVIVIRVLLSCHRCFITVYESTALHKHIFTGSEDCNDESKKKEVIHKNNHIQWWCWRFYGMLSLLSSSHSEMLFLSRDTLPLLLQLSVTFLYQITLLPPVFSPYRSWTIWEAKCWCRAPGWVPHPSRVVSPSCWFTSLASRWGMRWAPGGQAGTCCFLKDGAWPSGSHWWVVQSRVLYDWFLN